MWRRKRNQKGSSGGDASAVDAARGGEPEEHWADTILGAAVRDIRPGPNPRFLEGLDRRMATHFLRANEDEARRRARTTSAAVADVVERVRLEGPAIRVLVAQAGSSERRRMVLTLKDEDGIEVVAEAASADEALDLAQELQPDVVVLGLDIRAPGVAFRDLVREMPGVGTVLVENIATADEGVGSAKTGRSREGRAGLTYVSADTRFGRLSDAVRAAPVRELSPEQAEVVMGELARLTQEVVDANKRLAELSAEARKELRRGDAT
jgi:DNA-binding NarL/FixJ family response regulator